MEGAEPGHSIVVCAHCCGRQTIEGLPGGRLISLLHALFDGDLAGEFRFAEADCMAGCGRPLAVAFLAPGKVSYLFGDIDPDRDALHLLTFARLYRSLSDGWCNEGQRPRELKGKTLARIPALCDAGVT
ncbi:MAG: DUF1636 family protein [Chitinophagaceae bacterium]|nr:DUF1636 family protein [Chitinophagaceae bacterium]